MNPISSPGPAAAPKQLGTLQLYTNYGARNAVGDARVVTADGPVRSLTSTTLDDAVHEAAGIEQSGIGAILQATQGFGLVNTHVTGGDFPISSIGEPTPAAHFEAAFTDPAVAAFVDQGHVAYAAGQDVGGVQEIPFVPPH